MDRSVRCLVAEDDPATRAMLTALLDHAGYAVLAVPDGEAAWAALRAPDAPELALIDWHMPGLDGVDVVRRLRAEAPHQRLWAAILSGRSQAHDAAYALAAGADAFIAKPPDLDEILAQLEAAWASDLGSE